MPKLVYYGHACCLVESTQGTVIIDPFISGNPLAPLRLDQVPKLSSILVTHGHSDHAADALPLAERDSVPIIGTFELATSFQQKGAEGIGMNIGGAGEFPFGWVKLVQALHSSSMEEGSEPWTYTGMPTGILYRTDDKTLYHLGDTGIFSDLELIGKMNAPIDVALVPIGDFFTMGIHDAVEACRMIAPRQVVPIHYNTFPPIQQDPTVFAEKVRKIGIECTILKPGESLIY